jgi:peptide/nickel transport system permease protein
VGATIVGFWILIALFWSSVVPYNPSALDLLHPLQGPSSLHWLGTDDLGRDVLSRLLAGASSVLVIAPLATLLGIALGTTVGLVSGYYRGLTDDVVMRVVDALMSLPGIVIVVLMIGLLCTSQRNVILLIALGFSLLVSRTVRSAVLPLREAAYVEAAKMRGEPGVYIMATEILPGITGPIIVEATTRFGYAVLATAGLSYLGLGLQRPSPDWGLTVALESMFIQVAPWTVLFPALALASLLIGVNLVADTLRRAMGE